MQIKFDFEEIQYTAEAMLDTSSTGKTYIIRNFKPNMVGFEEMIIQPGPAGTFYTDHFQIAALSAAIDAIG